MAKKRKKSAKKTRTSDGKIPLPILERRLAKLTKIVSSRKK